VASTKTDLLETFHKLGFIGSESLQSVKNQAAKQGIPPLEAALLSNLVADDAKGWLLAERLGLPYVAVDPASVPMSLSKLLPESLARENLIAPIAREEGRLTLAVADPFRHDLFLAVAETTGTNVRLVVAPVGAVAAVLSRLYPEAVPVLAQGAEGGAIDRREAERWIAQGGARCLAENILHHAVSGGYTGIRLTPSGRHIVVKGRTRKGTVVMLSFPLKHRRALLNAFAGLAGIPGDPQGPTEAVFQLESSTGVVSFRLAFQKGLSGTEAIVKVVPDHKSAIPLDAIGFNREQIAIARKILSKGQGFYLLSTPERDGGATTLFALLREVCRPGARVVTVEERFRTRTEGYIQLERRDLGTVSRGSWTRLVERLEPDALLVENATDPFDLAELIQAARGGIAVMCGIRRPNFEQTLGALLAADVDPFLLAGVMRMIMHQRLVDLLCLECRRPVPAKPSLGLVDGKHRDRLSAVIDKARLYLPSGCTRCNGRGYSGKMALAEILPFTPAVQNLVSSETWKGDKFDLLLAEDFCSVLQSVHDLLSRGMVTYEDVLPFFR
jgi:type IV pilus assembly protein PilB